MDPADIVDGVLRSVLGGRRKRSRRALKYATRGVARGAGSLGRAALSHPSALLTAAGLVWGIIESLQGQAQGPQAPAAGAGGVGPSAPSGAPLPPLPVVGAAGAAIDDATRLVHLAVSAAQADGTLSDEERTAILAHARSAGVGAEVEQALAGSRPLAEIVAGVTDPAQRATLYGLAFTVARADEGVNGAERIYLARLAQLLGLDPASVQSIEQGVAVRIDAEQA